MSQQSTPNDADRRRDEARRWVRRKRIFYTIVGIYLSLSLMWFAIDLLDDSSGYWFYWPMLGTGIAVAVTAVVIFGVGGLFGVGWEQRQIEHYVTARSEQFRNAESAWSAVGV